MNPDDFNQEDDIEVVSEPSRKGGLIERILKPESLQRMMACGGGLLVVGFVVWLWSIGVFANPVTVAVLIGSATLGTIVGGVLLHTQTRYQLAGTGLTLLGSLALPLNLWFYDAQGLITLANGGHLWIPAALCCVIYTFVAWIMRDARFVYAIVGGVVMTGMLFLADASVNQFWYLMPQVTFLTAIGWTCVVAGRQFPDGEGEISQKTFGQAFRRAGVVVLSAGLVTLGSGQVAALLATMFTYLTAPLIATMRSQQLWAVGILLGTSAGFAVEHFLRRPRGGTGFGVGSVLTGVWGTLTLVNLLGIRPSVSHLLIGVSVLVTAVNLLNVYVRRTRRTGDDKAGSPSRLQQLTSTGVPLAMLLGVSAVVGFVGQWLTLNGNLLFSPTGWTLVVQLTSTAIAIWSTVPAFWPTSDDADRTTRSTDVLAFAGAGTATLALWTAGITLGWSTLLPYSVACLGPAMAAAVIANVSKGPAARGCGRAAAWGALNTTLVLLSVFTVSGMIVVTSPHLAACGVLAAAAMIFYLTAASHGRAFDSFFGHAAAGLSFSQALVLAGCDASYSLALAPAVTGVALAVMSRLIDPPTSDEVSDAAPVAPNLLVLFGNVVGVLLACSRLVSDEQTLGLIGMLSGQLAATTVVGLMARSRDWKLAFRAAALAIVATLGFTVDGLVNVSWYHRVELASLLGGTALLVLGYVAWSREGESRDGMATSGLTLGSLATVIPLAVGLVCCRLADTGVMTGWRQFHEVAAIVAGVALLGSGLLCRVRSTTIGGATLLFVHAASLVTLIHWPEQLQSISVIMMIGGGLFFGTAILLSIYRDRLLAIPVHIKEGDGVFRVFKWR